MSRGPVLLGEMGGTDGGRRQVLVAILGMEDRFDWKACTQSEAEDREDVQAFKTAFAPFDPSFQ